MFNNEHKVLILMSILELRVGLDGYEVIYLAESYMGHVIIDAPPLFHEESLQRI